MSHWTPSAPLCCSMLIPRPSKAIQLRPVADIAAAGLMCRTAALDRRGASGECEQRMVDEAAVLEQQAQDRIAQLEPPCS